MLINGEFETARSGTGLVWKSVKEITELPLTNKGAYRRDLMGNVALVTDTIREFEGYLSEANNRSNNNESDNNNNINNNDDDIDDDDDDGNEEYSDNEIPIVNNCVIMFKNSITLLKLTLQIFTLVGDTYCDISDISTLNNQLEELSIHNSNTVNNNNNNNNEPQYVIPISIQQQMTKNNIGMQIWISEIMKITKNVTDSITDLGCELYPPVIDIQVNTAKNQLFDYICILINYLFFYEDILTTDIKTNINDIKRVFQQQQIEGINRNENFHSQ